MMRRLPVRWGWHVATAGILALAFSRPGAGEEPPAGAGGSSYLPVAPTEPFEDVIRRMVEAKPSVSERHREVLAARYDLADRPAREVTMFRGKPVQEGVRIRLPEGVTWEHNLRAEQFFETQELDGRIAAADGPIKTFPLRGIKESPPYLHDGRLLTLEDTVEFFNLVLGLRLEAEEKQALVAFLRTL